MNIHKNTRLLPSRRKELADEYFKHKARIKDLAREYRISRMTVTRIISRARNNDHSIHKSVNRKFRCIEYGMKRLAKVERQLEERLKKKSKRYNKSYPGEMMHVDTKRLPLLDNEKSTDTREFMFVAIDDYSRELYAMILPNQTQFSSRQFLEQTMEECPYAIEQIYSDNGTEYRGSPKHHAFVKYCEENNINQRFTMPRTPRTNGKAERVIRTLMDMWYKKTYFKSREHRKIELIRFVNYYNTVKPHKGIDGKTPMEQLINYFYPAEM